MSFSHLILDVNAKYQISHTCGKLQYIDYHTMQIIKWNNSLSTLTLLFRTLALLSSKCWYVHCFTSYNPLIRAYTHRLIALLCNYVLRIFVSYIQAETFQPQELYQGCAVHMICKANKILFDVNIVLHIFTEAAFLSLS